MAEGYFSKPLPPSYKGIDERGIAFPLALIVISALTLTTLPMYLNLFKPVRKELAYSALSFFIVPLTVTLFGIGHRFREIPMIAMFIGPFWLALSVNFYFYRRFISTSS
ncbi:MAG: hypothetical protein EOO07_06100 [Chitinophagaceae bacterium]|nr:MAG: hypothetical protein EOO07_06100 [Chitinophagaceae bacterium]